MTGPQTRLVSTSWLGRSAQGVLLSPRSLSKARACLAWKTQTDRVRGCGRLRRKKQMWHEMTGDVPGRLSVPDPSLGGAPRNEGPATHHLGAARPTV